MIFTPLRGLVVRFRERAAELRESFGDDGRAKTLEWAAAQLTETLDQVEITPLDLTEAAQQSGYSADHLGRLLRESKLPNAGKKGTPRIRPTDLPSKAQRHIATDRAARYDPKTDARALRGHA